MVYAQGLYLHTLKKQKKKTQSCINTVLSHELHVL